MAWWWAPILFLIGAVVGAVIMAVCAANSADLYREQRELKKWWDQDE